MTAEFAQSIAVSVMYAPSADGNRTRSVNPGGQNISRRRKESLAGGERGPPQKIGREKIDRIRRANDVYKRTPHQRLTTVQVKK